MKYLYILITILFFVSCQDAIDINLQEGEKKIVIDANINWERGTLGSEQSISITETTSFYNQTVFPVNEAIVKITEDTEDAGEYEFLEDGNTGIYKTDSFRPKINQKYILTIVSNGETFKATEILKSVTPITEVEQSTELFFGEEATRVDFIYVEPADEENYYLAEFSSSAYDLNIYRTWKDEFINGNEDSVFQIEEDLKKDETLLLSFYGISKDYYNYVYILLNQNQNNSPFAPVPSTPNGNCINITNPENKPFGYFRLSQVDKVSYVIE